MAEPIRPAGEASAEPGRPVAETSAGEPTTSAPSVPAEEQDVAFLAPPPDADDQDATLVVEPAAVTAMVPPAQTAVVPPTETAVLPPALAEQQPVLAPAAEAAPPPPAKAGNRIVATAWVLLAAGLFEVLYLGALALIILLLGGGAAVAPGIRNVVAYPFAWLPVLFFFLLFELTVLLVNRAGRFTYVVASLIVGFLVYVASVLLISILVGGGIGDTATLARAFESPEFVLTGLVAREVMLWTGFAIGARGTRVRRRNKEARRQYQEDLADARS